MTDAAARIAALRRELNRHNHLYYVENAPEISDRRFDELMRELEELETAHPELYDALSPTQRVGSDLSKGFEKVLHERPMMSLANTYDIQDVDDWFGRIVKALGSEEFSIVGELKFDGAGISLTYEHGRLVRAVTRGDGTRGDDVTANIKAIRSIPLELAPGSWPDKFEIRGEILMPWKEFERLNAEREEAGETPFANPRNAGSGTLKMLDPRQVSERRLDARFYHLLGDELPADNHYDCMLAARAWGFHVSAHMQLLHGLKDVDDYIHHWDSARAGLPVATDGLVFKVNDFGQQRRLGFTAKSPRWAVAYKFSPEQASTPLLEVTFETGRMGIVTPVANLEPVLLSGTMVKRASLHNEDIMEKLGIHRADWLVVEKAGEIIPQVIEVDMSHRRPDAEPIRFVSHCPECGTALVRVEGEAAWRCPNIYGCRPQLTGRIEHFCSRRMMNIDGIGEETARLLFDSGRVESIGQLYQLGPGSFDGLEGIGPKTVERILSGIAKSREVPFWRLLYALSIPNVGETTARRLAGGVVSMDRMESMSVEELSAIQDIGPVIAQCIHDYLREPFNRDNIEMLRRAGLQMSVPESEATPLSDTLAGKQIVISGTFARHSRDEYKAMIEAHGGKNAGSISGKTSFLLGGDGIGPAKLKKCESLGIPILSEDDFLGMLSQENS